VTGWVSLSERDWGTRIDLTCTYRAAGYGGWTPYAMFVRTTDGRTEQVGTWKTEPGREMHVTLATSVSPDDIASVVVKTSEGQSVLSLTP
jgi:hypothetical protein